MIIKTVGKCDLEVNAEDNEPNYVTVYKNEFNEDSSKHWSYSLLFIASFIKNSNHKLLNGICVESDKQENDLSFMNDFNEENTINESTFKRSRLDGTDDWPYYRAELLVYDKQKNCLLTDGEYTVVLQPCQPPKVFNKFGKYNRFSSWQEIKAEDIENWSIEDPNKQYGSMEVFRKGPILRFQLSWSLNPKNISINGLNQILSNDFENDSNIVNNMNEKSFNQSYNGNISSNDSLKNQINSSFSSNSTNSIVHPKRPMRVIYQFCFNNSTRQQTKPQNDLCCPWCSLNCQQLYSLIKHLKLCHNRFTFNYIPDTKCARIDVSINECYDGSYAGNPHDLSYTGFAFSRNGPIRRNPVTHVIVCRPKRFAQSLSEFDEPDDEDGTNGRTYVSGHNRLYYHTNSCLPIRPQEMDYDSEAENDPKWMREKTQLVLNFQII